VRFAISVPQFVRDGRFDPSSFRAYAERAEVLGFEGLWTQEQVLGTMPTIDSIAAMTYAAACTEHIRLGCAVFVFPLHSPVHLAKSIASLDQLSRGRVDVGIDTGGTQRMFSAFAVDPHTLVTRFNEGLTVMERLWTEPEVTLAGRFWQLEAAAMEPKPYQKPRPPLWFGGSHPDALRRAVRRADGFFGAGSQSTDRFEKQVQVVREALDEHGRDPATFRIAKRVYLTVDDDAGRAEQRTRTALHELYASFGLHDLTPAAAYGPPDVVAERLREVAAAGAEMILLNPMFDDAEQMERLVEDVLPHLA
jgi:probable F420-dependent oxidoreductase